jgi:hypothetical protein
MRENLNGICNLLMALSLVLLLIVAFVLFLVVGFEMCYKLVDVLIEVNHLFWWVILSLIGTFSLAFLTSIINTEKK